MKLSRRTLAAGLVYAPWDQARAATLRRPRRQMHCLSIGNNYVEAPIPPLRLARRDALLMHDRFRDLPDSIVPHFLEQDASRSDILDGIDELTRRWRPDDLFVFFFSGHGVQLSAAHSGNALVTVEPGASSRSNTISFVSLRDIVMRFRNAPERATAPLLVFLDACRDNPFRGSGTPPPDSVPFQVDRESVGLALPDIPGRNLLFCYATNPGERANDACPTEGLQRSRVLRQLRCDAWRGESNGPFAAMLSQHILRRVSVSAMLTATVNDVSAITFEEQIPWVFSSMTQELYLTGYPLLFSP